MISVSYTHLDVYKRQVPGMPVYFYHIPVLTGVSIPMYEFLERISEMLPNFAGIKYTQEDLMDFMKCLNYKDGRYDIDVYKRQSCKRSNDTGLPLV